MKSTWDPSSVSPSLKPAYLTAIAERIWEVQEKVARQVQPDEGDNNWVAGCTGYRRRCVALERMQLEDEFKSWLWAGFLNNHFTVKIDGFPVRIFRTTAEGEVPERYAERCQIELDLLGRALGTPNVVSPVLYRIEVVTAAYGRPTSVALVEIDANGDVSNTYHIPRAIKTKLHSTSVQPIRRRKPAVVPKETQVGPTKEKEVPTLTIIHQENPA